MTERITSHVEQVTREQAVHLGQAALELGNGTVNIIANEGETFVFKGQDRTVREGNVGIQLSAEGDQGPLQQRAAEIGQQAAQEQRAA